MNVTSKMASRWVKAAFLAVTGLVIALYADRLVSDLEEALIEALDVRFAGTWELLNLLLWILVAWLFVLAAITVILSFREEAHTISDVMARLDTIEGRLTPDTVDVAEDGAEEIPQERAFRSYDERESGQASDEEVPPPPRE